MASVFPDAFEFDTEELVVDFDKSLNLAGIVGKLLPDSMQRDVDNLRELYNGWLPDGLTGLENPRIPKVIHQVWLGGPLPEKFRIFQQHWRDIHPDWEYRLWTDSDVENFEFDSRDLFDSTDCFGQKVDILRAEIICRFGGLYVDVDYDCFKRLDIFHHASDFYGTIRLIPGLYMHWPEIYKTPVIICTSLFGAKPGHPLLKDYLRCIRNNMQNPELLELANVFQREDIDQAVSLSKLIKARKALLTTYLPFYEAFMAYVSSTGSHAIAMPPPFFNPVDTWWERYRHLTTKHIGETHASFIQKGHAPYEWNTVPPEAFTVHHSLGTWL